MHGSFRWIDTMLKPNIQGHFELNLPKGSSCIEWRLMDSLPAVLRSCRLAKACAITRWRAKRRGSSEEAPATLDKVIHHPLLFFNWSSQVYHTLKVTYNFLTRLSIIILYEEKLLIFYIKLNILAHCDTLQLHNPNTSYLLKKRFHAWRVLGVQHQEDITIPAPKSANKCNL